MDSVMGWFDVAIMAAGAVAVYAIGKTALASDAGASLQGLPPVTPKPAPRAFPAVTSARNGPSKAALRALKDATAHWPTRNQKSDGIMPSAAHLAASPNSDHNTGEAFDITHDPASGCDGYLIAQGALNDPRTKYIIFRGKIFNRQLNDSDWRPYTGSNPHNHHCHVSVLPEARDDDGPWPWAL